MGTSVGDVNTDVPMLVNDARRVFTDGPGLDSELPTYVLCSISEEVEEYEGGGLPKRDERGP